MSVVAASHDRQLFSAATHHVGPCRGRVNSRSRGDVDLRTMHVRDEKRGRTLDLRTMPCPATSCERQGRQAGGRQSSTARRR